MTAHATYSRIRRYLEYWQAVVRDSHMVLVRAKYQINPFADRELFLNPLTTDHISMLPQLKQPAGGNLEVAGRTFYF